MSLLSAIIDTLHFKRKDGSEYIVYPATKEKAVTDENGQRLDRKLEKIQNDINNVVAGELPDGTTYVDLDNPGAEEVPDNILLDADTLQGHGADYFAAKTDIPESTEPWDYVLKYPDKIMLQNSAGEAIGEIAPGKTGGYTLNAADGTTVVNVDADKVASLMQGFNLMGGGTLSGSEAVIQITKNNLINALKNIRIATTSSLRFVNSNNNEGYRILIDENDNVVFQADSGGWKTIFELDKYSLLFNIGAFINNSAPIYFKNKSNAANYRILCGVTDILKLQVYKGDWLDCINIYPDGSINLDKTTIANANILIPYGKEIRLYNDTSIRFNNLDNSFQNYEIYSSPSATDSSLVTRYKPSSGSIWNRGTALHPNGQFEVYGDLKVDGNISAPNIASTTAELLSIQQDLTEKDIESIKTQQKITTMELAMIESGVLQS